MAKYGTKEYYEEELYEAEQRLKVTEAAVTALLTTGKVDLDNIIYVASMLETAREDVKTSKQVLEAQHGA